MIVVEHDEQVIAGADYVIDIGPEAGAKGGRVVVAGSLAEVLACEESPTGRYLSGRARIALPEQRRSPDWRRCLELWGASAHNLKAIHVRFPLSCFVCVTGVSGSGKSTLVRHVLLRALRRGIDRAGPRPGAYERISGTALVDRVIERWVYYAGEAR